MPAVILALGAALGVISLIGTPLAETIRHVSQGQHKAATSQAASRDSVGLARPSVNIVPAVQLPGRWSNASLADPSEVDWDDMDAIKTLDERKSGELKWDPHGTGRLRVCDKHIWDRKEVRGILYRNGEEMVLTQTLGDGCVETGPAKAYDPANMEQYSVKVCLIPKQAFTCNTSNTRGGKKWPESDDVVLPIIPSPPNSKDGPGIYSNPDRPMSNYHARDRPPEIDQGFGRITSEMKYMSYGTSVGSIIITGGMMALKHKRGEFGTHAAKLGWITVGLVVPSSTVAIYSLVTSIPWLLRP